MLQLVSHRLLQSTVLILALASALDSAEAGVIFGNNGLVGGLRWDAAPRMVGGNERSLDGGLRYSLQGGSFEAYRDQFQWFEEPPSVADFQLAVEQAFAAWTAVDPVTGLHTSISFVADLTTDGRRFRHVQRHKLERRRNRFAGRRRGGRSTPRANRFQRDW